MIKFEKGMMVRWQSFLYQVKQDNDGSFKLFVAGSIVNGEAQSYGGHEMSPASAMHIADHGSVYTCPKHAFMNRWFNEQQDKA